MSKEEQRVLRRDHVPPGSPSANQGRSFAGLKYKSAVEHPLDIWFASYVIGLVTSALYRTVVLLWLVAISAHSAPLAALIIDGQNNHDWKATTPVLKRILEEGALFAVEVATAPAKKEQMGSFRPAFGKYKVIISNYNGEAWPRETQVEFVSFVRSGGGFVAVHAANNSFPEWPEYNEMIGVGGWGGRTDKSGPYLRLKGGRFQQDDSPGVGGSHGAQHEFVLETRAPEHPIMKGLPQKWLHAKDELYDRLRGPAVNVTVLASAFSDKKTGGTGLDEPLLFAIKCGQGRVFHTALGHSVVSMSCAGFAATLRRGAEWAATGKVTQLAPEKFPTAHRVAMIGTGE
ncbi:MAG: ThuA domain-containing protein [Verrucomicrobia subdivision 3 bacterium]|nr:ThuA domain-containing protein [Limisphaerales bacterium]